MPYSSSIQVVNDANGAAYAFLADNGSLWQCQWNTQAERWDQGQVVPGAFGGEKMQALYLDNLWATDSNGSTGSQPGIVLAYRVGEGSNAEIYASLGQWNSDGQLAWSAPVALTDDQVEDQAFSLMENASGGFSLVVQKQQAATPVESLLDKLGSAPADQLEAELKAASSADRPDSDLYSTSFAIQLDDSGNSQLQELTGTTPPPLPTALSAAATPAAVSSNPLVFGGNSQLSRGQLITPPIASPTLRQSGPMLSTESSGSSSGTEGGGVKWKGGAAGQANFSNGGALRMGALVGQNLLRWQLPNKKQSEEWQDGLKYDDKGTLLNADGSLVDLEDGLEQDAELVDGASSDIRQTFAEILNPPPSDVLEDAEDLLRVFQDYEAMPKGPQAGGGIFGVSWKGSDANPVHPPHWQLRGTLGLFNAGLGGPTVLSTFKMGLDAGNNDAGKITYDSLISSGNKLKSEEWTKVKSGNSIGIGGDLSTTYLYQGKGKPRLVQLQSEESISLDWDHTSLRFSAEGGSLKLSTFLATGWMFQQILSSATGDQLPSWLSYIGYIGGALADIEKNAVGNYSGYRVYKQGQGTAAGLNSYSGLLGGRDKGLRALQWVNGGVGSSLAALGPAAAIAAATSGWLESDDTTFSHSSGLQFYTRATGRYLYKSVAGLQVTLANKLIKFLEGEEKGVGSDQFFANLGIATPLGGSIPLISYTITKTWGHGSSEGALGLSAQSTDSSTSTSKGAYTSASSGSDYPFTYTPQSGGNTYYSTSTSLDSKNPALLGGQATNLQILTLDAYSGGINPSKQSSTYPITLYNQGSGLRDGEYTRVPILGVTIDGTIQAAATASFTVQNGRVQADGFQIDSSGTYLMLPESSPNSGVYALLLDVFSTGIATPPGTGSGSLGNFLAAMPMITLDSSRSNAPLQFQPAQRVSSVAVDPADQPATVIYPQYNASTQQVTAPASNDNSLYTYSNVAVQLFATNPSGGSATLVPLLNPTASSSNSVAATVTLSGGVIQRVDLDQALLFALRSAGTTFALQLTLPAAVTSSLPQGTAAPSFSVEAESFSYGNVVADEQFSAQQGLANAGVFLASGLSDQLPLYGAMASWPVQNRVAYVSTTGTGQDAQTNVDYLNGNYRTQDGYTPQGNVSSSQLSLGELYSNPNIVFSAASSPTAVTLGGPTGSTYASNTFVAWVEASDPVIPNTVAGNGEANFQAFMEALYGNQRINYRINRGGTIGWEAPILADLYSPDNAIIRHLQAFTVANSAAPGGSATLLVWDETSIAAIQGAVQSLGSAETASIPTVIKAGWINPNATTLQWNDLFMGTDGKSTIQTIAWNPSTDVGLTIEDIAIASQTVVLEDGSISQSPLLTWSQDVRTPYRESVLKDQPTFYLQFNDLQSGISDINIGSINSSYTSTFASDTGLNFAVAGALPKSQATAVQNVEGIGVLSTGLGTSNSSIRHLTNNVPQTTLTANSPVARFEGAITGTTLTVSAFSAGSLAVGDLLSGPGLLPGTTVTALESVDAATGVGTYTLNQSQNLPSSPWIGVSEPSQLPLSSFAGSVAGSVLTVTAVGQGNLAVGDQISGPGIPLGTTIIAVNSADPGSGVGTYTLDRILSTAVPPSALLATPAVPVAPYTVEFWAQLQPGSNPNGAGLVALGQPSAGAVGASTLPDGWLLNASFVVDRVTYQQAAARGLISSIPSSVSDPANTLYGWEWGVVATGANTTAMGGNGGSNLYSNALLLNNLSSGQTLDGVNQFLANYNLTAADLIGGTGSDAATMANVPITQLQFSYALDPSTGLPNSSLNGIAVDTSTAILNQGLVQVSDGISANLTTMFEALWDFESKTGEAKVNFSLSPSSSGTTTSPGQLPNGLSAESYAGYELGFSLARGTAVSVNASGQLVFDIGKGTSITSAASGSAPADLRDGQWHYIVASFLPTYQSYEASGVTVQLPTNMGTASLFVDNQLVASDSAVFNPYPFANLTDQALLLANNSGGAIDQLAVYDKALSSAAFVPDASGQWPVPSAEDALALLDSLGYAIATKTPDPGAIPGAVTKHWLAHTVNPNDAVLATYTSSYNVATGTWSQASTLNPILQVEATTPSYSTSASLQDGLVISIAKTSWTTSNWQATTGGVTTDNFFFDPANQELQGVSVTLTNLTDTSLSSSEKTKTINLTPEQVLIGTQSLMTLQPKATNADFNFTVLTNSPSFNLVIPKDQLPAGTGSPFLYKYSATYTLSFADGTSLATTTAVDLNSSASSLAATHGKTDSSSILTTRQTHTKAIATADVVEAAPLQLKYVDSGVVLQSDSSAVPANSFGQSQVLGSFVDSNSNTNGWLAIAQPFSTNAVSDPAGRVWIQYTGQTKSGTPSTNGAQAPTTWLNALANSNFSPDSPNLPLLGNANNPSSTGGLLIKADPTAGWGQNFGQMMLVADVNQDGTSDLIIASPQANGGGRVVIIDGTWIKNNLTSSVGATTLDLSNPSNVGSYVTVLTAAEPSSGDDDISVANFGSALAFDGTTLWIGAPSYLRQMDASSTTPLQSLVPIGALYSYTTSSASANGWGTGVAQALANPILGSAGTTLTNDPANQQTTTYWGSQFGTAIAVNGNGGIAVSAPGVQASLLYSGTEVVQQSANGKKNPSEPYGDGALVKIQLPSTSNNNTVSSTQGTTNSGLINVSSQTSDLSSEESTYMQNLKALQVDTIASATYANNQAIQTAAVGAVYLFESSTDLAALTSPITAEHVASATSGGATFYGPNPWNTLGASGFGASLSFADYKNTNSASILAIGAPLAGGSGALYLVDTKQGFTESVDSQSDWVIDINLAKGNQYLAHLASTLTLYGAEAADNFASGLLDLGDVNNDGYNDLLIQAYNASGGAGNGYVLFGNDQLTGGNKTNPASGSVAAGSIGQFKLANGDSLNLSILSELGAGTVGYTGQGSFGKGDANGDGLNDIPLGSGPNGSVYLTWGHPYLEAIGNLQLSRLTSSNGFMLDGLATINQGTLVSIGDFNGDGYGDFVSVTPGGSVTNVRIEMGGNTQEILAEAPYNYYTFTVTKGTQVLAAGDVNGDGMDDIALFLDQNLSTAAEGNKGPGSTTGIFYGRSSSDLPFGSGFGFLAPVDSANAPLATLPGVNLDGGLTDAAPSVIAVGSILYAAVKGVGSTDTTLWFTQSNDGGTTWNSWTELGDGNKAFATTDGMAPSLSYYNNKLYLSFVNSAGTLSLSSWDPSSNNPRLWSTPSALSTSSGATTAFKSGTAPQLLNRGDSLGVMWVEGSTVYASSSTKPGTPANAPWAVVNSGSSMATPALARDGDTVYMAVQAGSGGTEIYWTSSNNSGSTWAPWQALPSDFTSVKPPSLAVVNGTLYLSYLGDGNNEINITSLTDAATNSWTTPCLIPGQSATYASLISETVAGTEQLAVYYVSNDATDRVLKAYSSSPLDSDYWTSDVEIQYGNNSGTQTASGPLAVSQYNGQTYVVYQGGTTTSPSDEIYIATSGSSNVNNGAGWSAQALLDPNTRTGLGLTSAADGLQLSYGNSSSTSELQLVSLSPQSGSLNVTLGSTKTVPLASSLSNNITILTGSSGGFSNLLLAGISASAYSNSVQTSLLYDSQADKTWNTPLQLQVLQDGIATPIAATDAPSFTWLGTTPVLAVNDEGTVRIYSGTGSGSSLQLSSTFSAPSGGPTIASAPVLTTTDTGLALTYSNSDGSISLHRLDVVAANGAPVDGIQINSDGSVDFTQADLSWTTTTLTSSNSGLSSSLATVPVSVNGNLLLANVRSSTSEDTEIWINAVPNLSDPDSTTWLNSSVQLPNDSGGWTLQQQSGTVAIGTFTPDWATDEGGLSPSAPTFAELNGVLYAAVVGYNSSTGTNNGLLYWNSSKDGGRTWSAWQQVPSYSSHQTPALAAFQGSIYMAYVGTNSDLYVAHLTDASSNSWSQVTVNNQTCQYVGMTVESGDLAVYYVGTNSDLYRTATSTPTGGGSWSASQLIKYTNGNQTPSQTASGNLAVTTITSGDTDTTYVAYQGGTTSSASDTLYLTYSSDQSSSTSWSQPYNTPQPATANRGGVTLTHNHSGLLLGFADKLNGEVVYVVQQSSDSGSVWSPFTTLAAPTGVSLPSSGSNTSFSLLASAISNDVLVGAINNGSGANSAINLSVVSELPPSTSLSSSQTESNLSAVGDLNGDGFDDLVVAANNVVVNPSSTAPTLATGLRLITGAANSSQITANNAAGSSTQSVQLAPWQGVNNSTPVASLSGPDKLSVTTAASLSGWSLTSSAALSGATVFTATAGDLATAQKLFPTNTATTLGPIPAGSILGNLGLISSAGFGDLNGDGAVDYLDPAALTVVQGANGQTWNLWSIRAAGDVNGNGVDDVLLSLAPQGPAYGQVTSGQPSALQSALVDGSLFEVKNNQFSLALAEGSADGGWTTAGLRTPLNPYTRSQLYDIASTATSAYLPSLQNWFDPILGFKPGSLTAASTVNSVNPDTAESYAAPAVAIGSDGEPYLLYSGYTNSSSGAGIWMAYQQSDGSWTQRSLSVGSNASILSPSAVFYQGKLTIAYTDNDGYLHVAWCEGSPQDASATWTSYQVETTADESSQWNPTLVVEAGRLALYFPSNSGKTVQQNIRYLYSTDPFDTSSYGNWGGTVNSSKTGYSGISGTISLTGTTTQPVVTSPIAATTFQGRTVLAFRSYPSSGSNLANGHILLLTQVASAATASDPSTSLKWVQTDTNLSDSIGVGLATDQALLYLTSTTYPDEENDSPEPQVLSLSPSTDGSGTWALGTQESVDGPGFSEKEVLADNPFESSLLAASVLNPFFVNGSLSVVWAGGNGTSVVTQYDVQVADLKTTVGTPSQQALAGYSIDGDIDINGDGFRDVLISDPSDASLSVDNQYALFGGDYLNIASQVGTAGNDTLVGTALVDVIYSVDGADVVISNGGADVIYTGSGDDQIAINGNAFLRIDAGSGFDVLQLAGTASQAYNFSLSVASPVYFAGTKLQDIELIDSRDYGANTLSFDQAAVNAINADRILFVTPDTSDTIDLSSEFTRNSSFDTSFAGSLWSAYAAGTASTPNASSPALLYVLNPSGASDTDWLSQHVLTSVAKASTLASAGSLKTVSASSPAPPSAPALPSPRALLSNTKFGDGLTLLAYQVNPLAGEARFAIERLDGRQRQVVSYASSSANSTAEPGRHYDPIAGLLAFEVGELRKEITVPIHAEAFAALGTASLSLAVEELQEAGHHSLHLVLGLDPEAGDGPGLPPALSGFSLTPSSSEFAADLTFRADTNGSTAGLSALKFQLRQRSEADSRDSLRSETVEILDQAAAAEDALMLHLGNRVGVSLDRDQLLNQQVSARLQLLFSLDRTAPTVSAVATPTANGLYGIGTVIPITVTFTEAVTVDASGGLPTLLLDTGSIDRAALYSAGSGSKTLTFLYTVQAGDRVQQLELASSTALALNGATIQDAAGNPADLVLPVSGAVGSLGASSVLMIDGVAPVVTTIASANANGTYGPGALITLTARFSEAVTVNLSGGVPSLLLETGAVDRAAPYFSGSGTDTLVFRYTVQNGDSAGDLDLAANAPLALNGATLQDAAGNPADLALPAAGTPGSLAANAALVISGVTPPSLTISTATPVIEEGATLAVSIASDTLAPGTTTYWRFSGSGITAADFSPVGLSGSIALGSDRRAAFSRSIALDALSEGDEQLTLEFFADASRTQSLARSLFTIRDVVPKAVAGATDGRDVLIGTAADEIISGVPVVSALNGRGSYDTLTGNGGRDLFLLGTAAAVFYDDGNSSTPGSSDLAAITDFAAGDRVQLHGSAADYRLASGRVSGASGVMVYRLTPASGSSPAGSDELIGFLKGLTPAALTLTDPAQFLYV